MTAGARTHRVVRLLVVCATLWSSSLSWAAGQPEAARPVIEVTIDRSDRASGQLLACREVPIPPENSDGFFPAHVVALENGSTVVGESENSVVYLVAERRFEPYPMLGLAGDRWFRSQISTVPARSGPPGPTKWINCNSN